MEKHKIFISHSSVDKAIIDSILEALENRKVKCWIAPRDVRDKYARAITKAIESSQIFLLCLSTQSAQSEQVLNEIEMVYKANKRQENNIFIVPLLIEKIDIDAKEFDEIMYYIRRVNFITSSNNDPNEIADLIINKYKDILFTPNNSLIQNKAREESLYYSSERENHRLYIQNELTKKFDCDIYKEIFTDYQQLTILDVGCGNGDVIINRLNNYANSYQLFAFDKNPTIIEEAKKKYKNENTIFYTLDVTDDDFENKLRTFTRNNNIESFDVIHISMLLLHLKNPVRLLRILRRFLKASGTIFIKDIDDGSNFAYPDENHYFERIYEICEYNETSGERKNGRQIYYHLYSAGFQNITLKKNGLSSINMNYDEKDNFFSMYCKFVYEDTIWMYEKYPNDKKAIEHYEWFKTNIESIYDLFMRNDFIFNLGFHIYVAKK